MRSENVIRVSKTAIHPEEGEAIALEYFICQLTGYEDEILYGLKIISRDHENNLLGTEETPALTPSLTEIVRLAQILIKGEVTPSGLLGVLDDYFDLNLPSSIHAAGQNNTTMSL